MTDDVRMPENWSKGSSGGPEFTTEIVETDDGGEFRNQRWVRPRWRYEIAHNIKTEAQIADLRAFHLARRGRRKSFLLKDWNDFTSAADDVATPTALDQVLGVGDGAQTVFDLIKTYPDDVDPYVRPILWPVAGTMLAAKAGVPTAAFTVQRGLGTITFSAAPANGAEVTVGFEFDVPVRFEDDWLAVTYDTINSRTAGSVNVREVRS